MSAPSVPGTGVRSRADACPGALRLHPAEDGFLARVRLPGGRLGALQASALGLAAVQLGDGNLDLTARGNVQIRGLPADAGAELGARLRAAGMLPSATHERARNIVASPLSGLDGHGHLDVLPWAGEVDALLCGRSELADLSGRFLIGLDDGRGDVASLHPDVTVVATAQRTARLWLAEVDTPVTVAAADAARLAVDAASAFLAVRADLGSDAWRVAELPAAAEVIVRRLRAAGTVTAATPALAPPRPAAPQVGVVSGPDGRTSLSVLGRLGRVSAAQWRAITAVAAGAAGELRITPWRGIVVAHVAAERAGADLSTLAAAGFLTTADSPWSGASACTGRPGCARAGTDVRADAAAALIASPPGSAGLPVHWSGCERRCGHPSTQHVQVVASDTGYRVGHFGESGARVPPGRVGEAVQSARRTP